MRRYPYAFYVALDGNGINGLEGRAGVCLFHFDPSDDAFAYKIIYFDGASAGHATSISPDRRVGFLGNAGQHLLFYDAETLDEIDRVSTLRFEIPDTSLQGSTHVAWLGERQFVTAIGDHLYRFDLANLAKCERLGPHNVALPHAMKLTASGRYLVYGSMDNPRRGESCAVGIWDMATGSAQPLRLPTTCWHVLPHPSEELFYAISFRVHPQEHVDYHEWGMAYLKEYVYEIDPIDRRVTRHWTASRDTPAHINSDITISDSELIFCNGGSQSIVFVDLESFSRFDVLDERPDWVANLRSGRQIANQIVDAFARGGAFASNQHFVNALRVSRNSLLDSIYACQISRDRRLLFTANRGLNHITIYDYPAKTVRLRVPMPELQEFVPQMSRYDDPRLGFHHSDLVCREDGPEPQNGAVS
jgi:hypothetical protein